MKHGFRPVESCGGPCVSVGRPALTGYVYIPRCRDGSTSRAVTQASDSSHRLAHVGLTLDGADISFCWAEQTH